jgi:transposase
MLTHEYTYAYGAVDVCTGKLDSLILPHVNTDCMQLFLNEVSARHPDERIVMVIDGAGWHRSAALEAPENIYLLKLPPYAPELNPIEHVWDELREKFFHNRVFKSLDALEDHLALALKTLEENPINVKSIVSWPWIMAALLNSLMNYKWNYKGSRWVTSCGVRDPNPERDGCPGMRRTGDWLKNLGAEINFAIEDNTEGHGAFHRNPQNVNQVLDWFLQQP